MSDAINIHEAKARLSELVQRAIDGEDIVIARRNKPVVRLVALPPDVVERQLGWAAGKIHHVSELDAPVVDLDAAR
jgi:prevent-host-death family protein